MPTNLKHSRVFDKLRDKGIFPQHGSYANEAAIQICKFYKLKLHDLREEDHSLIVSEVRKFEAAARRKWKAVRGRYSDFAAKYSQWMNNNFNLPDLKAIAMQKRVRKKLKDNPGGNPGGKKKRSANMKKFDGFSSGYQYKNVRKLKNMFAKQYIYKAARLHIKKDHGPEAEYVMNKLIHDDKYGKMVKKNMQRKLPIRLTKKEALAFISRENLSKRPYSRMGTQLRELNCPVYPSWNTLDVSCKL